MKLYDPGTLTAFLRKHGISASKGLGQHFLCSETAVNSITDAIAGCSGVCEIGPGPGVLTGSLSEQSLKTIALELDGQMIEALKVSAPKADVRRVDALEVDLALILKELPSPRAVVSNLPYYITGPLVAKIADACAEYAMAVLMMQKEVALRIVAKPGNGDRGSLSVYLQTLFDISMVAQVPAKDFLPPPKVDSTVLKFMPKPFEGDAGFQEFYFRLVRLSFTQPRKTLANNLVAGLQKPREEVEAVIDQVGLEEKIRPHDLTQDQWVDLAHNLM